MVKYPEIWPKGNQLGMLLEEEDQSIGRTLLAYSGHNLMNKIVGNENILTHSIYFRQLFLDIFNNIHFFKFFIKSFFYFVLALGIFCCVVCLLKEKYK